MQNQKTSSINIDFGDLPLLDAKEAMLVEALGQGDNNSDAYRKAYGAEGYSNSALHVQACRKVAQEKIQKHLRALRAVGFAKAALSIQARLEAELAFAQRAELAGNFGAAGGAHDRINKLMGLYIDKHADVTDADPLATLKLIAQQSPELADHLAKEAGVEWQTRH